MTLWGESDGASPECGYKHRECLCAQLSPEFAERLVEIGLDVLNPIQPASMDPADLKARYGDRLCFWVTIDEQATLPFGSLADVSREVARRLATVGAGGGLIIGPTHHIQLDTPLENLYALVQAITGKGRDGL